MATVTEQDYPHIISGTYDPDLPAFWDAENEHPTPKALTYATEHSQLDRVAARAVDAIIEKYGQRGTEPLTYPDLCTAVTKEVDRAIAKEGAQLLTHAYRPKSYAHTIWHIHPDETLPYVIYIDIPWLRDELRRARLA